jgi:hypothetical protein
MRTSALPVLFLLSIVLSHTANAQNIETTGSRALGMGGAFVAVASDSSAVWWNPAGIAAGPFLDLSFSRALTDVPDQIPGRRERVTSFTIAAPMLGVGYQRVRLSDIASVGSTGATDAGREDTRTGLRVRSLPVNELGVALVHSVASGVHVGATFKYLRGKVLTTAGDPAASRPDLIAMADALEGGTVDQQFDVDVGAIAARGAVRLGIVGRHLAEPSFGDTAATGVTLQRQVRVGVAFDGDAIGRLPLVLSMDADLKRYSTMSGDRRVIAVGVEQWVAGKRLAVRAGARANTAGAEERAATVGGSAQVRSGLFIDAHAVVGGATDERGWGTAVRFSF